MTMVKAGHVVYTTGDDTIIAAKGSYVIGYGISNTTIQGSGMTFIGIGSYTTVDASHGKDDIYLAANSIGIVSNLAPGSTVHIEVGKELLAFFDDSGAQFYIHGATQAEINNAFNHQTLFKTASGSFNMLTIGSDVLKFSTRDNQTIDIHQFHAA